MVSSALISFGLVFSSLGLVKPDTPVGIKRSLVSPEAVADARRSLLGGLTPNDKALAGRSLFPGVKKKPKASLDRISSPKASFARKSQPKSSIASKSSPKASLFSKSHPKATIDTESLHMGSRSLMAGLPPKGNSFAGRCLTCGSNSAAEQDDRALTNEPKRRFGRNASRYNPKGKFLFASRSIFQGQRSLLDDDDTLASRSLLVDDDSSITRPLLLGDTPADRNLRA